MQAAAHNGKYGIVRQAGIDPVKIHHDLENEKQPQPMAQKSPSSLNYQHLPPTPLRSHSQPDQNLASPLDSYQLPPQPLNHSPLAQESPSPLNYQQFPPQPLNPSPLTQNPASPLNYHQLLLNPFQLVQKSVLQLNSQQFPPNPLSSPFQLAQKCAPASPQVQNPALKCARPFLSGFKMRAACAPRCANFPKNPIFSPKTKKTAIFDNTPAKHPWKTQPSRCTSPNPPTHLFHFFQETTRIHSPQNIPAIPSNHPLAQTTRVG